LGAASLPHGITGTVEVEFCGEPGMPIARVIQGHDV
jgi:hypothetical protein